MSAIPKGYSAFLVMLLLVCAVLFASCGGGNGTSASTSRPTPTRLLVCSTPTSFTTSVQIVIDHPVFVKQADGGYLLTVSIANCGTAAANDILGAWNFKTATISFAILHFNGPAGLAVNSEGTYSSNGKIFFVGDQPSSLQPNNDFNISGSRPGSLHITITVTLGSSSASVAHWEGDVAIPA